jgi:hypothetical protein
LPEQREGWKLTEDIGGSVKVVQTDKKKMVKKSVKAKSKAESEKEVHVDIVVEQGTTIVKEVVTPRVE